MNSNMSKVYPVLVWRFRVLCSWQMNEYMQKIYIYQIDAELSDVDPCIHFCCKRIV